MGHAERGNRNGTKVEPFQSTRTFQPSPPRGNQPAPVSIPGYINLGPDEKGEQEVLFFPIARRILISTPGQVYDDIAQQYSAIEEHRQLLLAAIETNTVPIEAEGETVRVLSEDGIWIKYGPAQSKQLLRRTGLRQEHKEPSLIIVPDTVVKVAPGIG